jgi:dihydropteroate synthase
MGILNVTPDSFADGGQFLDSAQAIEHAKLMAAEGAAIIDIGGQSTRPGFPEISAEEEVRRILPVVQCLARDLSLLLSIDTYKPTVARAALAAGAHLLNDVSGLQGDPAMAQVAAEFSCPVVVMHQEKDFRERSGDVMEKLNTFFAASIRVAEQAGLAPERLILDPGIGFLKTQEQNLEIIARLDELRVLGLPILLGVSRKSTIGNVLDLPAAQRLEGTLAVTALAVWLGVEIVRVHDVQANLRAAKMASALRAAKLS